MSAAIYSGQAALLSNPPPSQQPHERRQGAPLQGLEPATGEACPDACPQSAAVTKKNAPTAAAVEAQVPGSSPLHTVNAADATDRQALPHGDAGHDVSPAEKTRATLAAELALAGGFVLLDLADGSFLITRWNASRPCADLQAVAQFVRQVRGVH